VIGSGVFTFDDPASASKALEVHRSVVVPDAMQGYEEIPVANLGDEAFAYTRASGPAGGPGAIYEFRIRNAAFLVPEAGSPLTSTRCSSWLAHSPLVSNDHAPNDDGST
jgi:hypothetical protein